MRKLKPQIIGKLLKHKKNSSFRLLEHGARLQQLTRVVHALLPEPCRGHCRVANVHDGILAMAADTPAWAARLRFHAPQLRRNLQNQTALPINDIRVLVVPHENRIERSPMRRPDLSLKSASLLRDTAEAIADPLLQSALLRLAKRVQDHPNSGEGP